MLASGNLGLIYLMDEPRRLTQEEIDERHPRLLAALRATRTSALCSSARVIAARWCWARMAPATWPTTGRGRGSARPVPARRAGALRRTDGFAHVADIMVNSFYDADLEQGCAFEELISFHGGLGGPQTQAFLLPPVALPMPATPSWEPPRSTICWGWRRSLQNAERLGMPAAPRTMDLIRARRGPQETLAGSGV